MKNFIDMKKTINLQHRNKNVVSQTDHKKNYIRMDASAFCDQRYTQATSS